MSSDNKFACSICGRRFSTRRSLGIHLGWHANSNRGEVWNKGKKGVQTAWNKGLKGEGMPMFGKHPSKDTIGKMKQSHRKRWQDPEFKKRRTKEIQQVMATSEYKKKHKAGVRKVVKTEEYKRALMAGIERRRSNPNWQRSLCQGIKPNKPEKQLIKLLQKLFPNQWKYVGDGSFWLTSNGKHVNPDFIHVNQKKIIEMNGDYWHGEELTGRTQEEEEQQRIDLFAQFDFQTLVIWEHELLELEKVECKILEFVSI